MSNTQLLRYQFQAHPFHLVDRSPWPLLISFSLLMSAVGAAMYFHGFKDSSLLLSLGLILVIITMLLWFRDVVAEGTYLGHHTLSVQKSLNLGFVLFVVSEVMFFFSLFWGYFHSALAPTVELGSTWPPVGIKTLNPWEVPLYNTILLLSSGAAVTYGHHALIGKLRSSTLYGLILTVVLAVIFTYMQGLEYSESPFTIADGVFGTTFYITTGTHGLHVIIGTLFIFGMLLRIINYHLTNMHHLGLESAILYWHFVDIVWLFLFGAVYLWGTI